MFRQGAPYSERSKPHPHPCTTQRHRPDNSRVCVCASYRDAGLFGQKLPKGGSSVDQLRSKLSEVLVGEPLTFEYTSRYFIWALSKISTRAELTTMEAPEDGPRRGPWNYKVFGQPPKRQLPSWEFAPGCHRRYKLRPAQGGDGLEGPSPILPLYIT